MSKAAMDKAVILARGLGTRMRKTDAGTALTDEQATAAEAGVKALIPIDRPFLDYVLSGLADAGYKRICLVIGPEHDAIRKYYGSLELNRISIEYAVQVAPLGTADAVAAAESFAASDPILVINSDNYYPLDALGGLGELEGMGLAAFTKEAMLTQGNVPPERIAKFAVIEADADGYMTRIIEKPDAETIAALPEPVCLSMNCWRFTPPIFTACRAIQPSPRGELEITDAVQYAIDSLGERFRVLICDAAVLDMSSRADVPSIAKRLAGTKVEL